MSLRLGWLASGFEGGEEGLLVGAPRDARRGFEDVVIGVYLLSTVCYVLLEGEQLVLGYAQYLGVLDCWHMLTADEDA